MIIGRQFPDDDDRHLMSVQHSVYGEMVARLFSVPRDRYLAAARLLRVRNEFIEKLGSMRFFDHRTLQEAHDLIAGYFRFLRCDSKQLLLGESEAEHLARLEGDWRAFFIEELENLTADDEFTRAICAATAFGNKAPGYVAEDWIAQFLRDKYSEYDMVFLY